MNLLSDVITYVRRIIKSPSNAQITDELIIDYINRFWIMDVDARMQLFDLKTRYAFQTIPFISDYNMPLYSVQVEPGNQNISLLPVYQGFMNPVFVNGIEAPFYTSRDSFFKIWPNYVNSLNPASEGDGVNANYTFSLPFFPAIPGHIDMTGIISTGSVTDPIFTSSFVTNIPTTSVYAGVYITTTDQSGNNIIVSDSGQFFAGNTSGELTGLLMRPGVPPTGDIGLAGGYSATLNTVNYETGVVNVTFTDSNGNPLVIGAGVAINAQSYFYQSGLPRSILFNNNTISIRPPPNIPYLIEMDAYLTPAAFLNTGASLPFAYMAEYLARGAARKILSDTGDVEQFMFYEPLFIEQERLVWKRSQRQFTSTRTGTIFSELQSQTNTNSIGAGST
jgi:hypothetical protein